MIVIDCACGRKVEIAPEHTYCECGAFYFTEDRIRADAQDSTLQKLAERIRNLEGGHVPTFASTDPFATFVRAIHTKKVEDIVATLKSLLEGEK